MNWPATRSIDLQIFEVLYVSGNYSGILNQAHRRFKELKTKIGFTTFQLMTIPGKRSLQPH
ncbi:MAG: hypothetical protein MUO26_15575 [Methanotrichaceae archaeon]|nr:hypothetical protein [Methanotrichaceae archaeon]